MTCVVTIGSAHPLPSTKALHAQLPERAGGQLDVLLVHLARPAADRFHPHRGQGRRTVMRWEELYAELYDADDRAEIARPKVRLLAELKSHRLAPCPQDPRPDPAGRRGA
jgi:hypothetical protein